jgi:hypothetical protein
MIIQCEAKLIMQKKYIQCSKIFITCTFPFSTCAEQPNCALEKKPTHLISFPLTPVQKKKIMSFSIGALSQETNRAEEKKIDILSKHKGNQMPQVQRFRRGSSSRVQIELLTSLVRVQYLIEVPVITFHFYPQQIQIFA